MVLSHLAAYGPAARLLGRALLADAVDSRTQISQFLSKVRHRLVRRANFSGFLWLLAGLAAIVTIFPLLAAKVGHSRLLLLLGAAGAATVCVIVVRSLVIARRRAASDQHIARVVGGRQPEIASDLLSAVELDDELASVGDADEPPPVSIELVNALSTKTAITVGGLDPDALVPMTPVRKPLAIAGASAAMLAGVLVFAGATWEAGARALTTSPSEKPFAGAALTERPLVGDVTIELDFPAYTGRGKVVLPTSSGDFRALPGTTVTLRTSALIQTANAQLVFGPGSARDRAADDGSAETREPVDVTVDGRQLSAKFDVFEASEYRFLIIGAGGRRQVEARPHRIEIQKDEAPSVELHAPADELDVASAKRVELAFTGEDDFGMTRAELVFELGGKERRLPLPLDAGARRAQAKYLWDLAALTIKSGERVPYWVEIADNDTVNGPNIGKSKTFYLRVFSPRERHEDLVADQRALFEKLVELLAGRLTVDGGDVERHKTLHKQTRDVVVSLGTVLAASKDDKLAPEKWTEAMRAMRRRIDKLAEREAKVLARLAPGQAGAAAKFEATDAAFVPELENDVMSLADWLDRQTMENLLAITDEVRTHQERLRKLFEEYKRTGSPEILEEIERELRALEQKMAELASKAQSVASDVLDRHVNREALDQKKSKDCLGEVRSLLAAGDAEGAAKQMEKCRQALDDSAQALENSLDQLRDERFSEEQKQFQEMLSDLADLGALESELATDASKMYEKYVDDAAGLAEQAAKKVEKKVDDLIDKLGDKLANVPGSGLSQFAKEELETARSRLRDVKKVLGQGDLAEALSMARHAESGMQTALGDVRDENENGTATRKTRDAERKLEKAMPLAGELVDALENATPAPKRIMSGKDRKAMKKLARRQKALARKAAKLADKLDKSGKKLPGKSGAAMQQALGKAREHMKRAEERLKNVDPARGRREARAAADALEQGSQQAQRAARLGQQGGREMRDEPVRIPGADEYKVPEKFREDIIDAMQNERAPQGFGDMVKRYYEELVK